LQHKIGAVPYLRFLRRQLDKGPPEYRVEYANVLFQALLTQPWSLETESEAADLLSRLGDPHSDPETRLAVQVAALYQLTDAMVQARYKTLMTQVKDPSELTRTELRDTQATRMDEARRRYAEHLDLCRRSAPAELVPWMVAEWACLQVLLDEQLDEVADRCWEWLGSDPVRLELSQSEEEAGLKRSLERRFLLTLANLAARRDAPPARVDRLLEFINEGLDAAPNEVAWKLFLYQMLIALDRSDELADRLQQWIAQADVPQETWRLARGYLLAERGRMKEAIASFEPLALKKYLRAPELASLERWYMVLDQQANYEATLQQRLEMTEESDLDRWLDQQLQLLRGREGNGGYPRLAGDAGNASNVPGDMDKNVPRVFAVLFSKSSHPRNYLDELREFYRYNRDFRLLTGMAEALVGHTAGHIYPLLMQVDVVLSEVREEATCDQLIQHLDAVRQRADRDVDRRAIDLLEMFVERRCAELLDQPGPHAEKAWAAMRRAFRREWSAGEPRLMATLLASLGQIADEPLAAEQLRQLKSLHEAVDPGTLDRLRIAGALARAYNHYARYDAAINLLEAALDEYQAACDGVLPTIANDQLDDYVDLLELRGWYARGERVVRQQLDGPANAQQTLWLKRRLYQLYGESLSAEGDVSLGSGALLYREVTRLLQDEMDHLDNNHRRQLIQRLTEIYKTAQEKRIAPAAADLVAFAQGRLAQLLEQQPNDYHDIVGEVASAIEQLSGKRAALAMLIQFIETEPRWLKDSYHDGWRQHSARLARLRDELKDLGDLQQPLLRIVIAELRRELESRGSRNRTMYWKHYSRFWEEQAPAFLRTAETVYAQHKDAGETLAYVARYLAQGLDEYARAIEMLDGAHQQGILDASGRSELASYLHREQRYEESLPILQRLVEEFPDQIEYRTRLMYAYHRTDRQRELLALLEHTDGHFHRGNRWTEHVISQLAHSCLRNELYGQSVDYYQEVITLHKRTNRNRGIGGGTLSGYCQSLAQAYAGQSKTAEAVDAACEAIVSWGPRLEQRQSAAYSLQRVLRDASDLDQYIEQLDREAHQQGFDKPVVRKALGMVLCDQRQYAKAAVQLRQAVLAQPNDAETHEKLVECYDRLGDQEDAIRQSLALLELKPREIDVYRHLARRFTKLRQPDQVERTYTSIVEALPGESEGHAMLAEVRQEQGRWEETAEQWRQVARIRSLEPTGLLKLAAAQIRLEQWAAARETIKQLRAKSWPPRFTRVDAEIRRLEEAVESRRWPNGAPSPFDANRSNPFQ